MHPLLISFFELLFPARCLGCDGQLASSRPPLLCDDCRSRVSRISSPLCTCCGTPFPAGADHLCPVCQHDVFAFDRARSLFLYQEPLRTLILRFKFNGSLAGLSTFTALAEQAGATALFHEPDLILPVPLHLKRLRQRGFNQSLLLAKACFPAWKKKIRPDLLRRHRFTVPQTRLDGKVRRYNLHKAFRIEHPLAVQEKRILLVDDVLTTGSTLQECASVLREAGSMKIETFTVARAIDIS
ncbi:MAG: ComF family protein [Candidatus Electrothrix sp. YB6]